ncbi:MAG: hypothetical protein M0T78_05480 [Actinomycetota bacterium]|nr:hypothetical protein [Actinomycetota bacterium]
MTEGTKYEYVVTFGDVDAQRVTYNGRHLDIVDDFLYHFLTSEGGSATFISFRVTSIEIDYLASTRLGDRILVEVEDTNLLTVDNNDYGSFASYESTLTFSVGEKRVSSVVVLFDVCHNVHQTYET